MWFNFKVVGSFLRSWLLDMEQSEVRGNAKTWTLGKKQDLNEQEAQVQKAVFGSWHQGLFTKGKALKDRSGSSKDVGQLALCGKEKNSMRATGRKPRVSYDRPLLRLRN